MRATNKDTIQPASVSIRILSREQMDLRVTRSAGQPKRATMKNLRSMD